MNRDGFTLIEVLISIVMVSLAAVTLISYMNSGITKSAEPLSTLEDNYLVFEAVETINADYRSRLAADPSQSIGFYVESDLTSIIPGLSGVQAKGSYTDFSTPDENRKVQEISPSGSTMYVRIEVSKNDSRMVTILGN